MKRIIILNEITRVQKIAFTKDAIRKKQLGHTLSKSDKYYLKYHKNNKSVQDEISNDFKLRDNNPKEYREVRDNELKRKTIYRLGKITAKERAMGKRLIDTAKKNIDVDRSDIVARSGNGHIAHGEAAAKIAHKLKKNIPLDPTEDPLEHLYPRLNDEKTVQRELNNFNKNKKNKIKSSEGLIYRAKKEIKEGDEALSKKYNVMTPEEKIQAAENEIQDVKNEDAYGDEF